MNYLLTFSNGDSPYYVRVFEDQSWCQLQDPNKATRFESTEIALAWMKNNSNYFSRVQVVELTAAQELFNTWFESGLFYKKFPAIDRKLSRKYNPQKDDDCSIIQWHIDCLLKNSDEILEEDFCTWPKISGRYKHLVCFERFWNINTKTSEIACVIMVDEHSTFKAFSKDIDLVVDKMTYRDDGLIFPVINTAENWNFSVFLVKHNEYSWSIRKSDNTHFLKFEPLKKCFKFLRKHFSYSD